MSARRIALGTVAAALEKVVIAAVQLAMVPVLALKWGIAAYGTWVLLSTIPSFLAVSDFGFAFAAGTRMTMLVSRGERAEAVRVFQSAWVIVLLSSLAMATLAVAATLIVPAHVLPSAPGVSPHEARIALLLLVLWGITALQGSILAAGFKATQQFALGISLIAATILAENVAAMGAALAGGGLVGAAAALLVCRLLALAVQAGVLFARVPWLRLGFAHAHRREMKELLAPAAAIAMVPLGQASVLQGTALALGIAATEAAVPAFTATRTLSRVGLQVTQLLNQAIIPEYSAATARNDRAAQARMVVLTLGSAVAISVPFALILALWGQEVVGLWTHGVIRPTQGLMLAIAATVVLGGVWNPLSNLILAMNRQAAFSYPFVVLGLLSMPASYLLSRWLGATGAALAVAMLDVGMCVVILRLGQRLFPRRTELAAAARSLGGRLRRRPAQGSGR